jgi:hypothetical protein
VDLVNFVEQNHSIQEFRPKVYSVPDTRSIGVDFTRSIISGSPTRTIAHSFRTILAADECRRGQNTFAAVLTAEQWDFYDVLEKEEKAREFPFLRGDGGQVERD